MLKKSTQFLYGLRIIFTCLFAGIFIAASFAVIKELMVKVTVQDVILGEERDYYVGGDIKAFDSEVNGIPYVLYVTSDHDEGDTVSVILRDGIYSKEVYNDSDLFNYVNPAGRVIAKVMNNEYVIIIPAAVILIVLILLTYRQNNAIRRYYKVITIVTYIVGAICAISSGILWIVATGIHTWDGLGYYAAAILILIAYLLSFTIAWAIDVAIHNVK